MMKKARIARAIIYWTAPLRPDSEGSQLLQMSYTENKTRQGEETMQRRMHSREFKLEVVRQIVTGQKRPAQVCREYGLAESVLLRWRKEYQQRGESAFVAQQSEPSSTQEQRIAELERFCGQLALENQVLKKALQSRGSGSGMS